MKRIIVLGAGVDQIDFIKELKQRDYFVIAIDYTANPAAKSVADIHIQESTLDVDKVTEIAQGLEVERIVTACTDQALLTVAEVSERLGLPTQFTANQVRTFTQKSLMKEIMRKNGIPTSNYKVIYSVDDSITGLNFPLMVKPADCNSSKGVRRVNNLDEFKHYINEAIALSRTSTAIVEEFVTGKEVSIDAYITPSGAKVIMVGQLDKIQIDEATSLIVRNTVPAPLSSIAYAEIQHIAQSIANAFGISNSPLLIQAIVDGDKVNVIEFSARLGGGCKHRTIKAASGIDIIKANVDSLLGYVPSLEPVFDRSAYISRLHFYLNPGKLGNIEGFETLSEKGIVEEYIINKPLGTEFCTPKASTDRLGSILISGHSYTEIATKIHSALSEITITDSQGENMLLDNPIYLL